MNTSIRQGPTEVLRIKAAVRERDGYRCVECGTTNDDHMTRHGKSLHVHRRTPGTRYAVKDCLTLCYACHGAKPKSSAGIRLRSGIVSCKAEPSLGAALDAYLDSLRPRPTTTSVIVVAIEEYLKQQGFWPPPPAAP